MNRPTMKDPTTRRPLRRNVWALLLPLALSLGGCGDSLTEVNENPNAPTDVGASFILPAAIQSAAEEALNYGMDLGVTSLWVQHIARLQYGTTDRYNLDVDFSDQSWEDFWLTAQAESREVIRRGAAAGLPNQEAVGMILRSWIFQNMTDLWGDIPYSEALSAEAEDGTTSPAYDPQEEIYAGLIADLKAANAMMGDGNSFGSEDLLYGGDMEGWRRFSNSLRLRLAMRLSEVDPGVAASEAASAVAGGVFTSLSHQAQLEYAESAPNQHPYHTGFVERPGDYRVSATLVDTLVALADPRLMYVAAPAESDGAYRGLPNGLPDQHEFAFNSVSKVGAWHLRASTPSVFLSTAEVLLNQAEAAQRGWIGGNPADYYYDGITVAMEAYGIPRDQIDTYLAHPSVVYDPARALEQIGLQKWIALYDQGVEAFAEWRRTRIPDLQPSVANVNADRIPLRLPYPVSEQAVNNEHLQQAVSRQGGASINNPVWWDVP